MRAWGRPSFCSAVMNSLPDALALLALAQVEFADQLRQALVLDGVLVLVVPLDDLLLVGREVVFHEGGP